MYKTFQNSFGLITSFLNMLEIIFKTIIKKNLLYIWMAEIFINLKGKDFEFIIHHTHEVSIIHENTSSKLSF